MSHPDEKKRLVVAVSLLCAIVVAIVALTVTGTLNSVYRTMWEAFQGKEEMRAYLESWGPWAPAAFIATQVLQVVFAPIPGEFTGAVGGFFFDAGANIVYSTIGLSIGSTIAFLLARIIGQPIVRLVVSKQAMEKFHFLTERKGIAAAFVMFAIPGFPKDILSYLLGLSPMGFVPFIIVCTLGRIPGTIMLSYFGAAFYHENWTLLVGLTIVCVLALGIFYLFRDRIEAGWIGRGGESE